jgi:hypothetical protein
VGCPHPFGLDKILDEDGNFIGGRCPSCGSVAYVGDSLWTLIKRNLFGKTDRSKTHA